MKKILSITIISIFIIGCSNIIKETSKPNLTKEIDIETLNITDFKYIPYTNSRFGFSIFYPDFLTTIYYSDSGDGVEFSNATNDVKLTVNGKNLNFKSTAKREYDEDLGLQINVIDHKLEDNSYTISGSKGDYLYYQYVVVGNSSANKFKLVYPKNYEEEFKPIINRLKSSFNTPNINEYR